MGLIRLYKVIVRGTSRTDIIVRDGPLLTTHTISAGQRVRLGRYEPPTSFKQLVTISTIIYTNQNRHLYYSTRSRDTIIASGWPIYSLVISTKSRIWLFDKKYQFKKIEKNCCPKPKYCCPKPQYCCPTRACKIVVRATSRIFF